MRTEQEREAGNCTALLPPVDESLDEPLLVRRVRGRVAHDEDDRSRRVETEAANDPLVLLTWTLAVEHVGLRPARDDDAVFVDAVVAHEIAPHHVVLHDVAAEMR